MARNVLVDAGFLIALLAKRDAYHGWAVTQASEWPPPWFTCEAVLSEAFHLLGPQGVKSLAELLGRERLQLAFSLGENVDRIVELMEKYSDVPMSLADACLVRMTEILADPVLLTTGADFRLYRRHGRQALPCITPES